MNWNSLKLLSCLAVLAVCGQAFADEGDLVEKVAVRNRLFTLDKRWEFGGNVGFSLLSRLTDHYNFNLSGAYNFAEWGAIELRGGYAYSRHTSLADQIQSDFNAQTSISTANDLTNLWEMTGNAVVGFRFQPFYGKLNLVAEAPIHFQFYGWLGGGAGLFKRESLVICVKNGSSCDPFSESKVSPILSAALGLRFWLPIEAMRKHSFKIEVRDYAFLDSYYLNVTRANVNANNPTAGGTLNTGFTNLTQLDIGYAYIF